MPCSSPGAALFGWLITTDSPGWSVIPAVFALVAIGAQYNQTEKRWQMMTRQRLNTLLALARLPGAVRATVHVPRRFGRRYRQAVDYVPQGNGRGRSFPLSEGIAGESFTTKQQLVENFTDQAEYDKDMVTKYGYSVEQLSKRTRSRRSYMAVPIVSDAERVVAVVYFD
jgi:hypothetical protein